MLHDGKDEQREDVISPSDYLASSTFLSIQDSLENLKLEVSDTSDLTTAQLRHFSDLLRLLRPILIQDSAKDSFVDVGGLDVFIVLLDRLKGQYHDHPKHDVLDVISASFEVLSEVSSSDTSGVRHARRDALIDIWPRFEEGLIATGCLESDDPSHEWLLGLLFALALQEDSVKSIFRTIKRNFELAPPFPSSAESSDVESATTPSTGHIDISSCLSMVAKSIGSFSFIHFPRVLQTIWRCWSIGMSQDEFRITGHAVLLALARLSEVDDHNLRAIYDAGLCHHGLDRMVRVSQDETIKLCLERLLHNLLKLGIDDLDIAANLIHSAERDSTAHDLLLQLVSRSGHAPRINFSTSGTGYAAVEFADIGARFPPSQHGYSVNIWLEVEEYDKTCHTTILGIFDPSQTCFLLLYLEAETHQLVLQTSTASKRPSIRFRTIVFERRRRCHVVVTHHRSSQLASLYVDGTLVEQQTCTYPRQSPTQPQAFIGLPYDLAPRLGRGVTSSNWSLTALHLFSDVLTPELILVYNKLGLASYGGNFNDSLGSFLTYEHSTALTLIDELQEARFSSSLGHATRSKKLSNDFVIAVTPLLLFAASTHESSSMLRTQSAEKVVKDHLHHNTDGFTVNAAKIHLQDAIARPEILGHLTEGVTFVPSHDIANSYWRLCGGLPLLLQPIALATDIDSMLESVSTMFTLLQRSWRLSETCERENGFAILMWLIRVKLGRLPHDSLDQITPFSMQASEKRIVNLLLLILKFVGIDVQRKQDAVLVNPLAYRAMVLDCSVWLDLQDDCQQVFFDQFIILLETSHLRSHNIRRLAKMRILNKMLDSFVNMSIHHDAEANFQIAMSLLFKHTMTADVMRALALHITASLQNADTKDHGLRILGVLEAFLCDGGVEPVTKFSRTVSSKWLLHLLDGDDSKVVLRALRILARMLTHCGPSYSMKFQEKSQGFDIVRSSIIRWHMEPFPYAACFGIMFGIDLASAKPFEVRLGEFYQRLLRMELTVVNTAVWSILAGLLQAGLEAPEREVQDEPVLSATLSFLETLSAKSKSFREYLTTSSVARDLFCLLFRSETRPTRTSVYSIRRSEAGQDLLLRPLSVTERVNDYYLATPNYDQVIRIIAAAQAGEIAGQREFAGLGLFLKAPEASLAVLSHRATIVVRALLSRLVNIITTQPTAYHDPRCLVNVAHFASQTLEAVTEGWLDVGFNLLHYLATLLTYLRDSSVRGHKMIRLSSATIDSMADMFRTLVIVQLAELDQLPEKSRGNLSIWLSRWKYIVLSRGSTDDLLLRPLFYLILRTICPMPENQQARNEGSHRSEVAESVKVNFIRLWETCIHYEPTKSWQALSMPTSHDHLSQALFAILDDTKADTQQYILNTAAELIKLRDFLKQSFDQFVNTQSKVALTSAERRCRKREERLHVHHMEELAAQHAVMEHQARSQPWHGNIRNSETMRQSRTRQDRQDNDLFYEAKFSAIWDVLRRLGPSRGASASGQWLLDGAEAKDRQKLRLRQQNVERKYLSKRARSASSLPMKPLSAATDAQSVPPSSRSNQEKIEDPLPIPEHDIESVSRAPSQQDDGSASLDDFEIIEPGHTIDRDMVDINRKVMRSLRRGEQILEVHNVTRVRGLEPVVSLLIVGKKCLYMLDNLFYRASGEVVSPAEAPIQERDQYIVDILGTSLTDARATTSGVRVDSTRSWTWLDILNVSKRRFLLRDVGLELFFRDGRSYLITTPSPNHREILYSSISKRIEGLERATPIDRMRIEQLVTPESNSSRFFSLGAENSVTTHWLRGEMSNFHYLMLVNTMAGRTTTDLTQYPVFPWVLKDFSSEELDLDDASVYRDLSKPMGAQDADREAAYKERYRAFAEMADPDTPAFHYGTHYSSAMIVSSYLLRLEPFTAAHCLLQGGYFDLPERLFDSIEKTWLSASRDTVTDVRELTPEFYYLPDFLRNVNGYDFGTKESNGEVVNDVKLPPWAKGDPHIFIAKHREALESRYVTENLHKWMDLVFGYKQRGDAAIEATNVFHHLSYHGVNLDQISDERERLAAVGIIHNFGQTPRQIFFKAHDQRTVPEGRKTTSDMLSNLVMSKEPIIRAENQIADIIIASKSVFQAGPYRSYRPPSFSTYIEWGNTDRSLRFYRTDSGKLFDLFEALHTDHISMATWVDHRTLVTASPDSTVCIWSIEDTASSLVDLELKSGLFGHRQPVNLVVAGSTLSTLLTCASGEVFLWDLNTYELLRKLDVDFEVEYAHINHSNGHILLCNGDWATIWTINGHLLVRQIVCDGEVDDHISCCSFYESTKNEWIGGEYVLTGHTKGIAKIWRLMSTIDGIWRLDLVRQLNHTGAPRPSSSRGGKFSRAGKDVLEAKPNTAASITCVKAVDKKVYTGDEAGQVYEWTSR